MSKNNNQFLVAGVNWIAEVDLTDYQLDSPQTEAATRAVEAFIGKRDDIPIYEYSPLKLSKQKRKNNELQTALLDLMADELVPGCGIGMLLCIGNKNCVVGKENEWYISSKTVLENVGIPKLVSMFDKKYPVEKNSQTT